MVSRIGMTWLTAFLTLTLAPAAASSAAPPRGKEQQTAPPEPMVPLPLGSTRPDNSGFFLSIATGLWGGHPGIGYQFADGSRLGLGQGLLGHMSDVWYSRLIHASEDTRCSLLIGTGIAGSCEWYLGHGVTIAATGGLSGARGLAAQSSLVWYPWEGLCFSLTYDVGTGLMVGWQVSL